MKTAWIAGASGLVGAHLLRGLLADAQFETVVSLGRKTLPTSAAKLIQRSVDFAAIDAGGLAAPDVALCALGTTIGKAGSQSAFRAIDHDAVLAFGQAAFAAGAPRFVVVTALGADPGSRVFYNRVKGETEADLRKVGFATLAIAQPSLLLGDRAESRPLERVAVVTSRLLGGLLQSFAGRPIEVEVLARALLVIAREAPPGVTVYPSSRLQTLAAATPGSPEPAH